MVFKAFKGNLNLQTFLFETSQPSELRLFEKLFEVIFKAFENKFLNGC
jgi:hypothetical protein